MARAVFVWCRALASRPELLLGVVHGPLSFSILNPFMC